MKKLDRILTATTIYARARYVECPHCGAQQDGWVADPRGAEEDCEDCGLRYRVDVDADVELD